MRNEVENPMLSPRISFKPRYQEPSIFVGIICACCDRKAVYSVNGDPHCKLCFYDAIDTDIEVRVKAI